MIDTFATDALTAFGRNLSQEASLGESMASSAVSLSGGDASAHWDELISLAKAAGTLASRIQLTIRDGRPLRIAVVGDYSAGKSSFINHLLRDDTLCPVRDDPTTSHVSVFGYSDQESITRRSQGGRNTRLTREQYTAQVQSSGALRSRRKPSHFIVKAPIPILQGIELLDTPGFNNLKNAADTEVTENVLTGIDVVLFLVDVNTGTIPDSGTQRLGRIRASSPQARIHVIFTKADTKAPSKLGMLREDCQQRHGELFDGQVLAYSTLDTGQRSDIATRDAMSELFSQMFSDRHKKELQLLTHQIRLHVLERQHILQRLEPHLENLIAWQLARAASALTSKARILERFERLQSDMESVYRAEVRAALAASFRVTEIDGTGWIFKDARIVRTGPALPSALTTFKSVCEIRERLRSDVKRYIHETTEIALRSVDATCTEATAESAGQAEKLITKKFNHILIRTYDFDTTAREKLGEALGQHSAAIAETLWGDWVLWIDGLYEILEDQHFAPIDQDAQCQARALENMLKGYRSLVLNAASLTMEFA